MNSWKELWDFALKAARENRFPEGIAALRTIAKRSPKNREWALECLAIVVAKRNAYRADHRPRIEYHDPKDLESIPDPSQEDPFEAIGDAEIDPECAKWEAWLGRSPELTHPCSSKLTHS